MNYYKRHLGDYAKDTGWLTTYQHGVYALLLDWYYSNEKPIPVALSYRIVKARTGPEKRAVDEVISAFFDVSKGDGFAYSKRADIDISKCKHKGEVNSLIAKERESTKRARSVLNECDSGEPSHKPLTSNHKKAKECRVLPEWLPADKWQDFVDHRKAIGKRMTDKAEDRMLKHLESLRAKGHDALTLMDTAIRSGWQDVYEPKPAGQFNSPVIPARRRPEVTL